MRLRSSFIAYALAVLCLPFRLGAEEADTHWWTDIKDGCLLYGSWESADLRPDGKMLELTMIGDWNEGGFRAVQFADRTRSLKPFRIYGYYKRQESRLEAHYCEPCEAHRTTDHVISWEIVEMGLATKMGLVESNYPSEVTLIRRGDMDPRIESQMNALEKNKPTRFLRSFLRMQVDDMFPKQDPNQPPLLDDVSGRAENQSRMCALLSWRRLRPRR